MRRTRMADHQGPSSQTKRVGSGDGAVRRIRKLESAHRIQAYHSNPIRNQRVLPTFRR